MRKRSKSLIPPSPPKKSLTPKVVVKSDSSIKSAYRKWWADPVNSSWAAVGPELELPRLYRNRARLRVLWRKFWAAVDAHDQVAANRIRVALPRPVGDHVFWDLILREG